MRTHESRTPPHRSSARRSVVGCLCVAAAVSLACAGSTRTTETSTAETSAYASGVSLHGSSAAAALDRGKAAVREADFPLAIRAFESVAEDSEATPEQRAEAWLRLGQASADPLNPAKNPSRAAAAFRELIQTYPDSPLRADAEARLAQLPAKP